MATIILSGSVPVFVFTERVEDVLDSRGRWSGFDRFLVIHCDSKVWEEVIYRLRRVDPLEESVCLN